MVNLKFEVLGKVPSKKNLYHIGRGRFYPDKKVNEYVNSAYIEIKKQLGTIKRIEDPIILDICFLTDDRSDLDNMIGTWFDLLQNVGLIKNDRQIRRINARREKVRPKNCKTFINLIAD